MTEKLFKDLIWINNINPLNKHTNTWRQKQDNTKQLNEYCVSAKLQYMFMDVKEVRHRVSELLAYLMGPKHDFVPIYPNSKTHPILNQKPTQNNCDRTTWI